jgi:hypothetical protein
VSKFKPSIAKGTTPLPVEFPSGMLVRVSGYALDSEMGQKILKDVSAVVAPFVSTQRQNLSFNPEVQYHRKSTIANGVGMVYAMLGGQETLTITVSPQRLKQLTSKTEPTTEEYPLKVCVVFYEDNKIAAFDMNAFAEGSSTWPPALAKRTLTESNWATSDGLNYDTVDGQTWFRPSWTLQMKNNVAIGNLAVHRLKFENNVVTLAEDFFQFTRLDLGFEQSGATNVSCHGFTLVVPTMYAFDEGFIIGDVMYDKELTVVNEACFNLGSIPSYFEFPGSPGATGTFIDQARKVWNSSTSAYFDFSSTPPDDPVIGSQTVGIQPEGIQTTVDLAAGAPYPDYTFGFSAQFNASPVGFYDNVVLWLPVLEQAGGLDTVRAVQYNVNYDLGVDSNTISINGEGSYSNSGENYNGFIVRAVPYGFPGERPVIMETEFLELNSKRSFVLPDGTTIEQPAEIAEFTAGRGDCRHQVSNGVHRFHTLTLYRSDYVERVDKAFLNGKDCTSSMEEALDAGIADVHTVFFDVPYASIWLLK